MTSFEEAYHNALGLSPPSRQPPTELINKPIFVNGMYSELSLIF